MNPDVDIIPYREECRSEHMTLWFVVLILYKGLLMVNRIESIEHDIKAVS
jgi:hypothetical protein